MTRQPVSDTSQRIAGRLLLLVAFVLLLYIVLPHMDGFSSSWQVLGDVRLDLAAVAVGLVVCTFILSGVVYTLLAQKKVGLWRTVTVQVAGAFANRLLPAGLGGMTVNARYLRKSGHSIPAALTVAATNNLLGFTGHILVLFGLLAVRPGQVGDGLHLPHVSGWWVTLAVIAVLAAAGFTLLGRLRARLHKFWKDIVRSLATYRQRPLRLLTALLWSVLLTCCHAAVFYVCGMAVGAEISLWGAFAAFTIGLTAGTATPTPGGLGGAEVGLLAGLVAYGVVAPVALAAVLLYRLLTYWLPLLPSFVAFAALRNRWL